MRSHRAGELRPTLDGTDGSEMFAFSAWVSVCVGARVCKRERRTARARQEASPEDWQLWQSLHAGLNARLVQSGSGSSGCLAPSRRPMTLIPCYCISQLLQRGAGLAPCCPPPPPPPHHHHHLQKLNLLSFIASLFDLSLFVQGVAPEHHRRF